MVNKEVEQTTSVYHSNHSTLPTLLEHRMHAHICMELRKLEEVLMANLILSIITVFHVQCVTLQHEKLL